MVVAQGSSQGTRAPVDVRFFGDAGPFGGTNLLAALPYPGVPLEPDTLYLAVVTTAVRDVNGDSLPPARAIAEPERGYLELLGIRPEDVAAVTLFRTDNPTRGLREAFRQADANALPELASPPVLTEEHDDYCVYATTIGMPMYQAGRPPYLEEGGGWARSEDGSLVLQRVEPARLFLTVPRLPAGDAGYPGGVFVRIGGGGDRPLIDRGPRDARGRAEPGSGYARDLSRAGYLGASVDGPLGGIRNHAAWDEEFVLYNMLNPTALRDNIRQSALELALFAHVLADLRFDTSDCAGASPEVRVRPGLVLIGHSNGATIAPIAAAVQPRYRALVLGGAGASWIRQSLDKESPTRTRPIISALFGYGLARQTFAHDPMLSLVQWAGEPADPMVYGRLLRDRDVLVFQGILDTYIPPPISNPLVLSLGLDLAGDALDTELGDYRSLTEDLPLAGLREISLPARGNGGAHTRVVTQLPADGIEDGHEVMFQQPAAHAELASFLSSLLDGTPIVTDESASR